MKPIVVDLSHWNVIPGNYGQAVANLKLTKQAGVQGLIHKATESTGYVDEKLKVRSKLARDAGLLFGTYHFLRPGDMAKQADHYLNTILGLGVIEPQQWLWCCDYEDPDISLPEVADFMGHLQQKIAPYQQPVLYTGHVLKAKIAAGQSASVLTQYRLWLAHYADKPVLPYGWGNFFLWQYSDKGSVPGIAAPTDVNFYSGAADELRSAWTGGGVAPPKPVEPPITISSAPPATYTRTIRITSSAPFTVEVLGDDHAKNEG